MEKGKLTLEKKEYLVLKRFMNLSVHSKDIYYIASIEQLSKALQNAILLDEHEMPIDVVRINSIITLSLATGDLKKITLVLPARSDPNHNKISILTPLGMALIGRTQGTKISGNLIPETADMVIDHVVTSSEPSYVGIYF